MTTSDALHGPLPLPALPLDQEAKNDSRLARALIIVITIMVLIGISVEFIATNSNDFQVVAYIAVLLTAAALLILAGLMGKPMSAQDHEAAVELRAETISLRTPIELDYRPKKARDLPQSRAGPFAGGFFIALAVCAGGFFLLGATVDRRSHESSILFLMIVVAAVVGAICMGAVIGRRRSMLGFGQGMTVGMILGMLALGPCAFCYLLTLK